MPPETMLIETLKDVKNPFTLVGVAIIVGAVVRLLKTKTVGDWLDATPTWLPVNRIPKERLPDVALFVGGVITFLDGWLNGHLPIGTALLYAALGAVLGGGGASLGHQVVAKRLAGAKEDPPPPAGPSRRDPGEGLERSPYREPASQLELAPAKRPPRMAPAPISILERLHRSLCNRSGFYRAVQLFFRDRGPVPLGVGAGFALSVVTFVGAIALVGCGFLSPKTIVDAVLRASDIACLETGAGSHTDDPDAAAVACKLAQDPILRSVVRNLVGQRVAAKRAGFVWPVGDGAATDGGIAETVTDRDAGK